MSVSFSKIENKIKLILGSFEGTWHFIYSDHLRDPDT